MVSNKTIIVMIIIALLLLGASLLISSFSESGKVSMSGKIIGEQQGSVNLVVSPPAKPTTAGAG